MKKITSIIVCLLLAQLCGAQVTEIASMEKDFIFLANNVSFCRVPNPISFDSVQTNTIQQKFVPYPDKKVLFRGYDPFFYWSRFSLKNSDITAKEFVLLFGGLGIRRAEVWQSVNGAKWNLTDTIGYKYPFSVRKFAFVHHGIRITIPPAGTVEFYLNADESHTYKVATFMLVKAEKMFRYEHRFYLVMGFLAGVLLLFALTNLYMYFTAGEKIHLWYCLYNISILFFSFKNEGLDAEILGLDFETGYRASSMAAVAALSVAILLHIVQLFLVNIPRTSLLFKLNSALKYLMLSGAVIGWIIFYVQPSTNIEQVVFTSITSLNLASVAVILTAAVVSFKRGFKPALFILAGLCIFLIGSVSRTLFVEVESAVFPPSLFEIGLVFEAVIISFGIQHRYNLFKREKEMLARQLADQQLSLGKQIINTQENERKRIAQDLHDELGSSLAALKLHLQKSSLQGNELSSVLQVVDKASADTRHISHNLMPPEFEGTSLYDVLHNYYARLNTETAIRFHFLVSGQPVQINKEDELVIYRILMELTGNICRHSGATEATVQMLFYEATLELMVEDNGHGFSKKDADGIGLKNIQSRVNYLQGEMRIDSSLRGITIIIQLPLKNR